jgi:hypothetical protein
MNPSSASNGLGQAPQASRWLSLGVAFAFGALSAALFFSLLRPAHAGNYVPPVSYDHSELNAKLTHFSNEDGVMVRVFDNGLTQVCMPFHDNKWYNIGTGEDLKDYFTAGYQAHFRMVRSIADSGLPMMFGGGSGD